VLTPTLANRHLALETALITTISTPCASQPPRAVDSVSLHRSSKTSSHRLRVRTDTQPRCDCYTLHAMGDLGGLRT
jgi:hypothetical protein